MFLSLFSLSHSHLLFIYKILLHFMYPYMEIGIINLKKHCFDLGLVKMKRYSREEYCCINYFEF